MIASLQGEGRTRVSQIRGKVITANNNFVVEIHEALNIMERGGGIELHVNSRGVHEEYPVTMDLLENWERGRIQNDSRANK
jgi:hypothetical protein